MRNLVRELRAAAAEIAASGHDGWGNTCSDAADVLERYELALEKIEDFTNGYGDVGGIACGLAKAALRPEVTRWR